MHEFLQFMAKSTYNSQIQYYIIDPKSIVARRVLWM